ncbi:MAG TPA: UxaA family hydrolase [Thermoclostridium caenicola]|uniref:UxaA family hydrolase n=1 Tax=Thermoclostridium caenicola TaxID=659425 RepID=UPI002CA29223|nr:UxaA family hydrolase [Thermoclostridium caenicola]HPO76120.1 UxaA family hydrolase [Thermoclostridium caenicola]
MENLIVLSEADNVGNAIEDIEKNEVVSFSVNGQKHEFTAKERIPFGFKIAIKDIKKGEPIIKYHEIIGKASRDIDLGHLVHVHNVEGCRGRGDINN